MDVSLWHVIICSNFEFSLSDLSSSVVVFIGFVMYGLVCNAGPEIDYKECLSCDIFGVKRDVKTLTQSVKFSRISGRRKPSERHDRFTWIMAIKMEVMNCDSACRN